MEDLGCGIAAEIADACCFIQHCCSQLLGGDALDRTNSVFKLVILAIKTIKGTGVVEDSQVVVAMLRAAGDGISGEATARTTGTDKISHAVCGQGFVVIGKISFVRATTLYLPAPHSAKTAKTHTTFRDSAKVKAERTSHTVFCPGRVRRQTIRFTAAVMNPLDLWPDL